MRGITMDHGANTPAPGEPYSIHLPAPWEVFRPQRTVVDLAASGRLHGRVLDAGCGTGENALHLAACVLSVTGIDIAGPMIHRARQKAVVRGLHADFIVGDVLSLGAYRGAFDTVIDSGLFHSLAESDRVAYAESITTTLRPGGKLFMLCFSETAPSYVGPACLRRDDIELIFADGWSVDSVEETRFELRHGFVPGWLACLRREGT